MNRLPLNNGSVQPANFRRFKFRFNFENVNGQISGGEGEVQAVNYSSGLVKILALFVDQPGRVIALQFEDATNQLVIAPT